MNLFICIVAPVGFDEEIKPAFGVPQGEEAVRGYWELRVPIGERHLDCVLDFVTFMPEKELEIWLGLTSKQKYCANVAGESKVKLKFFSQNSLSTKLIDPRTQVPVVSGMRPSLNAYAHTGRDK